MALRAGGPRGEVAWMDEALRALADPTRRAILRLVHDDELAAGEIARHFPAMSRPRSPSTCACSPTLGWW